MIDPNPGDVLNSTLNEEFGEFFVEFSDSQNCFHIIAQDAALRCNFHAWLSGRRMDYRPLARFITRAEAYAFIAAIDNLRPPAEEAPH